MHMAKKTNNKVIEEKKLSTKIQKYLGEAGIGYEILGHKTVYTAFDAAATMKKKMSEIVKTLLVKADREYFLVLLPADNNLDFKKLASFLKKTGGKEIVSVKIPTEKVISEMFKIKNGAMSAFGGLYKLPVIADKSLSKLKKAVFPSGKFNYSLEIGVKEFMKMESAILGSFGVKRKVVKRQVKKAKKRK